MVTAGSRSPHRGRERMIELRVLGTLQLSSAPVGRDVASLVHQAKRAALLAYLAAATPRGPHRRDKLLALFWPELDDAHARAALNQAVYVLRATLGEDAIVPRGDGALGVTEVVWCDAVAFQEALDAGRPAEALRLYQGDLLEGFFISGAPEFERWLDRERDRLRRRASAGAWAIAESSAAAGDPFEAARWARRAADLMAIDEAETRRLMRFLHGLGDRAAAIGVYETFAVRLKEELELEPSAETATAAARIRQEEQRPPVASPLAVTAVAARPRHSRRWVTVAASIAVATAAATGAWAQLGGAKRGPSPVVRFTLEFPAAEEPLAISSSTIALSPDGSELVYLGRGPDGMQLLRRPLDQVQAVAIPHARGGYAPMFSPDGKWIAFVVGNTIRKVSLAGDLSVPVCQVASNVFGASWGPNNAIVFATSAGLWRVEASGGQARLLATADTARGERYRWPEILPDGRAAVVTTSDRTGFHLATLSLETGAVVALGVDGTSPHFVTSGQLVFARPDGALLAAAFDQHALRITGPAVPIADGVLVGIAGAARLGVSREGALAYVPAPAADRTLVLVDLTGHAETVPIAPQAFQGVRISPDGRRIAAVALPADADQPDIWTLALSGDAWRRVTFDSGSLSPSWTPDGRRIAFASKPRGQGYGWVIRWISADGTDSANSLFSGELGIPTDFTPDGRALLFQEKQVATGWDIWSLSLRDRRPRLYLGGRSDEHSPAVSPDGQWLAYASNESGRDEVYVRRYPAPGAAVQVSAAGGREPRWAPSGRMVFYRSAQGLVAAEVSASRSFRVKRRSVLFDDKPYLSFHVGAAYDVHPDGRHLLMVRLGSASPQVVVVLNWFAHLPTTPASVP